MQYSSCYHTRTSEEGTLFIGRDGFVAQMHLVEHLTQTRHSAGLCDAKTDPNRMDGIAACSALQVKGTDARINRVPYYCRYGTVLV
jgi:hypothetical protein